MNKYFSKIYIKGNNSDKSANNIGNRILIRNSVPSGYCDSAPAEFSAESGKLRRIWKYAQNLAENDVFGLPTM